MESYKMYLLIRKDLKMSLGKTCAQCGHATLGAYKLSGKYLKTWEISGAAKIALKLNDLDEMNDIIDQCRELKVPFYLVEDAGLTQLEPGTQTVLAIPPFDCKLVESIVKNLKLF